MPVPDCAVLVFTKAPAPGAVKTRLMPALSAVETAELYRELLERTLNTITEPGEWVTQLWCAPGVDHPYFQACRSRFHVALHAQRGRDLGERMHRAITATLRDYRTVLVIGCDCPDLRRSDLATARAKLADGYDVVLGPAEDGGYYLIGMRAAHRELFAGIHWGEATVLGATRDRLQTLRLRHYELPVRWDLDDVEDFERYKKRQPV
jgi:hypothetical protein